ncbi:hypothetical protein F0L68_30615 [Solihabitans fulvus]|uniref:Uncharacterized protein n=1 Tax=Solihabitans fulvus TaxID=1892852 RepID=A0A5B2WU81_9PSEU|nr:hypothetical protein [Solihabitans fulvus]KAA2254282.1 hypothetical protein F0L68_30615 [Solihabitans fulvus]
MDEGWELDPVDRQLRHWGGVPWWLARLPVRWHRCHSRTHDLRTDAYWCACGASTDQNRRWCNRNSRRAGFLPGVAGPADLGTPPTFRARSSAGDDTTNPSPVSSPANPTARLRVRP